MHASGGATRDVVPFEGKKVANRIYRVLLRTWVRERWIPAARASHRRAALIGKMYTFRLIE